MSAAHLTTRGRSVGCRAQEDARTKKPRRSGAGPQEGLRVAENARKATHTETLPQKRLHSTATPKQTVSQICCKPARTRFRFGRAAYQTQSRQDRYSTVTGLTAPTPASRRAAGAHIRRPSQCRRRDRSLPGR